MSDSFFLQPKIIRQRFKEFTGNAKTPSLGMWLKLMYEPEFKNVYNSWLSLALGPAIPRKFIDQISNSMQAHLKQWRSAVDSADLFCKILRVKADA